MKTVTKVSGFLLAVVGAAASVHAQGTAFTYQGHLSASGSSANGSFDLTFSIWDAASGPSQVGSTQTKSGVAVGNGLFTVVLDFGAGIFTGAPRWLEIGVRPAGSGGFTTLTSRQPITPAPYAMFAANGGDGGSGPWSLNGTNTYYTSGNVGIGTSAPQGLLDLATGTSDTSALFVRADPNVYGIGGIIHHQSSTYGWQELAQGTGSPADGSLNFHYVNRTAPGTKVKSNVLTLGANGHVGIGTAFPGSTLEVVSDNQLSGSDITGAISAGLPDGYHIAIDSDEIQTYFMGNIPATLYLNYYGGDVRIGSASATTKVFGTFVNSSDRNLKEDIQPVKSEAVLDRLLQLPVSTWKFKGSAARRHVGPMAQDFHAAFNDLLELESDDKTIAPLDEAGIAFVSIQALNGKVDSRNSELLEALKEKQAEITELKRRLEALEKIIRNQTPN